MKHSARIRTYREWGIVRQAVSFALTGPQMMADAEKYGRTRGVIRYRDDGKDESKGERDAAGSLPLGLSRTNVFPADTVANKEAGWSNLVGGIDYLFETPSPFGGGVPGLSHTSDDPAAYEGVLIPGNTGHIARLYLNKPPEDLPYPITALNWDAWQFQIADSSAVLQRMATTWTQENETALIELLGIKEPSGAEQEQIDELKRSLYEDTASIQLEGDGEWPRFYEIEFVPEIAGKVSVYCNGNLAGVADHTPILKTRKPGVLWKASKLVIRRNGGHFSWQTGYAWYEASGEVRWPYNITAPLEPLENMVFNKLASTPPGTSVTISQDEENSEIVATFTTSNQRVTPFLYLAQAYLDAGIRGGENHAELLEETWDSENAKNKFGMSPLLELGAECEGELRRAQFNALIDDHKGKTFANMGGPHYSTIENLVFDLEIGGVPQITKGIVKTATPSDWASAEPNQIRANVARADSTVQAELCDAWTLLEEHELEGGELVGDGLYLGLLLRRALRRIGTPWAEMEGIADGTFLSGKPKSAAGRILPRAAMGEGWAVVNSAGTLADFIYYLIERYGMGRILTRGADGIWYFRPRPTTTRVLYGHEVHFSSDPARHHSETYPGRFAMLTPIDLPRDVTQFFNKYRVRGADGYNDEPQVREWTIQESLLRGLGAGSLKYIGRERRMKTIEDSSLRTGDDLQWALRSAVELHGLPPHFLHFKGYYIPGLFVGDRVKASNANYIIRRLSGGNWENDEQNYLLQRVGY